MAPYVAYRVVDGALVEVGVNFRKKPTGCILRKIRKSKKRRRQLVRANRG